MAFKASFKFSDSREFDVLRWDVKFNRDVDPKGRLSLKPWGIALKFLFLHHENILFPND